MEMFNAIIAFSFLVPMCHSWLLLSSHSEVHVNITKNVTFECRYDNQDNGKSYMPEIDRIIIHKFKENASWVTYAEIHNGRSDPVLVNPDPLVMIKGHAGKARNSFLAVTWSIASPDTIGQYMCEVNGFAVDDTALSVFSSPMSVIEFPLGSSNLLMRRIEEMSLGIEEKYHNMLMRINSRFDDVIRDINSLRSNWQVCSNRTVIDTGHWPGGSYALLNTEAGCPKSSKNGWTSGYVRVHTESHFNSDTISNPSHLAKPVLEQVNGKHFFYISTCKHVTYINSKVLRPAWPRGSYCIHRVGGVCPSGFKEGVVNLDMEDEATERDDRNPTDITYINNGLDLQLHFCCRDDGSPEIPIGLPVDTPFYLYRFKGRCQEVLNANVTQEGFAIDVEDDNENTFVRRVNDIHPDSDPPRFYTCFYEKR